MLAHPCKFYSNIKAAGPSIKRGIGHKSLIILGLARCGVEFVSVVVVDCVSKEGEEGKGLERERSEKEERWGRKKGERQGKGRKKRKKDNKDSKSNITIPSQSLLL